MINQEATQVPQITRIAFLADSYIFAQITKKQTDTILLDLSNIFDNVSHCSLKLELDFYGIKHQAY